MQSLLLTKIIEKKNLTENEMKEAKPTKAKMRCTVPALPFLCSADALDIQNSCSFSIRHTGSKFISLTFPESITNLMPSMVMDVSAMLVDITHLFQRDDQNNSYRQFHEQFERFQDNG
jgi:hypothetical protein